MYLCNVYLPWRDKDLKIIKSYDNKWLANKIILGKKYELSNPDIFKYLVSIGTDITTHGYYAIEFASMVIWKLSNI
jgi:hypothetical protein